MIFYNTPEDYYGLSDFADGCASVSSELKKLEYEDVSSTRNGIKESFSQYYNESTL